MARPGRYRRYRPATGAALVVFAATAHAQTGGGVPWFGYGPVDTAYALAIDTSVAFSGRRSLLLVSLPGAGRATWIASQQIVDAQAYRNKRIRIRAFLRTQSAGSGALWFAVEGFVGSKPATLVSDSLIAPLHGTTSWRPAAAVFDVDPRATCVRFGSTLYGTGAVWLDALSIETVSAATPVTVQRRRPEFLGGDGTSQPNCSGMLAQPTNLDFEQAPS